MPWWGILLVIVGVQGLFLLVLWLVLRRSNPAAAKLLKQLEDSASKRLAEERDAERRAKEEVAAAYKELAEKQRELDRWYNDNETKIDEEAARAYKELAVDPAAVDRKLDELLGSTDPPEG